MPSANDLPINDDTYLAVLTGVDAYGWTFCQQVLVRGALFPPETTRLEACLRTLRLALGMTPIQPLPQGQLSLHYVVGRPISSLPLAGPVARADEQAAAAHLAALDAKWRAEHPGPHNPVGETRGGLAGTCNLQARAEHSATQTGRWSARQPNLTAMPSREPPPSPPTTPPCSK